MLRKNVGPFPFSLRSAKNKGHFTLRPTCVSARICVIRYLLEQKKFQTNDAEEIQANSKPALSSKCALSTRILKSENVKEM